jgi:hypothetical protein
MLPPESGCSKAVAQPVTSASAPGVLDVLAIGPGVLKALRDDFVLDGVSADLPSDFELFCRFPAFHVPQHPSRAIRPQRRSARATLGANP